jgi:hypothetical protein
MLNEYNMYFMFVRLLLTLCIQRLQLERVSLHESKRGNYHHTKKVIEQLILLGETDRAVQLLLETEMENPNYYTDAIK